DVARRRADDDGDLALEPEQIGALGAGDVARAGERGGRLEEVRRVLRDAPALLRAGAVGQVDGDDLARSVAQLSSDRVGGHSGSGSSASTKSYTIWSLLVPHRTVKRLAAGGRWTVDGDVAVAADARSA